MTNVTSRLHGDAFERNAVRQVDAPLRSCSASCSPCSAARDACTLQPTGPTPGRLRAAPRDRLRATAPPKRGLRPRGGSPTKCRSWASQRSGGRSMISEGRGRERAPRAGDRWLATDRLLGG